MYLVSLLSTQIALFFSATFLSLKEVFYIPGFSSDLNNSWVNDSSTRKYAQKNINVSTLSTNIKSQKDIFTLHSCWIYKIEAIKNRTLHTSHTSGLKTVGEFHKEGPSLSNMGSSSKVN